MTHILQLNASARPGYAGIDEHGSHSRNLTRQFVNRWLDHSPADTVTYRDIGATPPSFITRDWIQAAFTPADRQEPWMKNVLAESDQLIDELIAADILVIGAPLYNFGMPATLKAWIDLVIRMDRTVKYDPTKLDDPFIPMLNYRPRHAVILSSRGGVGFEPGGALAHMNHLEPSLVTALEFIGITNFHRIAVENQEAGGELLADSVKQAEQRVEELVEELQLVRRSNRVPELA
ncbi:NAD(P)H-dependent oxidoreductase [Marinobacter nanhaiticus D15-8W]|uniref:FMN dependent NADH:quinone oxidoreductase n=1 Tax=Marinobacter nanhaiticus D15-8W TaxID=626887 RepID=N6WP01_9GAMM|nr:NAD(P)H-dependent oxidoreductase [Marinobacter nanhaiticus]ENO12757.1 NAD(P)H dehydrogenase [Marinobacter nanhaiticus D15-8W]BES70104.1 NAD(P)H-dependent oxidoreductase [Marinobacter nanhaiticus D15-8W]